MRNTTKPLIVWNNSPKDVQKTIEMAAAVAVDKERLKETSFIASYSEPISPLAQNKDSIEKLIITSDYGIPSIHTPIPQAGACVPVTLAGVLVSTNAENLASVVISQVKRKALQSP